MTHPDFKVEPIPGLPEELPDGERILWQGRPDPWRLAVESLWLGWVIAYFAVLIVWRVWASAEVMPVAEALTTALPLVMLGAAAVGLILLIAGWQARATLYTITTARVAMRIGAALTMTLNLPFTKIASADLDLRKGTGSIALTLLGEARLSYLMLWPHVRPWRMAKTQPCLQCIPDAQAVAEVLAEAAETRIHQPVISPSPAPAAVPAE